MTPPQYGKGGLSARPPWDYWVPDPEPVVEPAGAVGVVPSDAGGFWGAVLPDGIVAGCSATDGLVDC